MIRSIIIVMCMALAGLLTADAAYAQDGTGDARIAEGESTSAAGGMRDISGTVTLDEATRLGREFLGPGPRSTSHPGIFESADGLRQFRVMEAGEGAIQQGYTRTGVQARFSSRSTPDGRWTTTVHLDVQP